MSNQNTVAQELAIRQPGNVLVVAGAGTGKTRTLVQRCLRLLLQERCGLDRILMVTFTEAAAAEMRKRIREELRKLQRSEPHNGEFIRRQSLLLDAACIGTLHSFCLQLVRRHTHQLGIDSNVVVLDESQTAPLRSKVLDDLLRKYYADQAASQVHKIIRQVGAGADTRIRWLVLRIFHHARSLADPDGWMTEQERLYSSAEPNAWGDWLKAAFAQWREEWLPDLQPFAHLPAIQRFLTAPNMKQASQALAEADEKSGLPRLKRFWTDAEFLASACNQSPEVALEEWNSARMLVLTLLRLTREFSAEYAAVKRQLGGLDFSDLEQHALRLLRGPSGGPTPVAEQWRERFQFIFVDECQDINRAQDAIVQAISRHGDGANRFLVGDVKQSIFRFRRADPSIFQEYDTKWARNEGGARIPLSDNFRSRQSILSFVNTLFSALMRPSVGGVGYAADAHLQFGTSDARRQSATDDPGPRVELHLITPPVDETNGDSSDDDNGDEALLDLTATEREARLAAHLLHALRDSGHPVWDGEEGRMRPVQWSDMAVLLRSAASRVESYAKEFANAGVPLIAARTGFFNAPEVSDLLNLLRILDNPIQDVPLLAVLRSPLAAFSLEELVAVRLANRDLPFWGALGVFHSSSRSSGGWKKVDAFLKQYERWRALARQSAVTDCLQAVLAETHFEAMLLAEPRGHERVANVHRLLETARSYDPYQRQGLYRFLLFVDLQEKEDVDHEPASSQGENAVRLMTIHGSKGLEFPVVLLSGLATGFNFRDLSGDLLIHDHYGICPKIWPDGAVQSYPGIAHWIAGRAERRDLIGEEMRLLYVAMTRARDTLLLTGTSRKRDPLGNRGDGSDGIRADDGQPAPIITDRDLLSGRSYLDWLLKWFAGVTSPSDWRSGMEGQNALLRWRLHGATDPILDSRASEGGRGDVPGATPASIEHLHRRLAWQYPSLAATRETAVKRVSEVIWSGADPAEEQQLALSYLAPGQHGIKASHPFLAPRRRSGQLSAADIGVAYHTYLQGLPLDGAVTPAVLEQHAQALRAERVLTTEEVRALDLAVIGRFWASPVGHEILSRSKSVQREVPFTARFSPGDLAAVGVCANANELAGEFFVTRGVVDLAVLLPEEAWILDFKTDRIEPGAIADKLAIYRRQLRLYAMALSRIYRRPVTKCWLHFFSVGDTIEV